MPTSMTDRVPRHGMVIEAPVGDELTLRIDGVAEPVRVTIEHKSGRRVRLRLVAPACVHLDRQSAGVVAGI